MSVPQPNTVLPPPQWLNERGKEIWALVIADARNSPTWRDANVLPLARYCAAFDRYLTLHDWLADKGINGATFPVKDSKGNVRNVAELPQAKELRQLHEMLLRLEEQFGLVPHARAKLEASARRGQPGLFGQSASS